ncbi:hypothetical protein GALL_450540 [mine drainage metagenome]|uniref:Uncharacterized protein n=1 Tax=mine drainage metagenome TaxID=410659 RepID=A0A1J5PP05_9ZZZZ
MYCNEGEGAAQLPTGPPHRFGQIIVALAILVFKQVRHGLGIGIGGKLVALLLKLLS